MWLLKVRYTKTWNRVVSEKGLTKTTDKVRETGKFSNQVELEERKLGH